MSRLVCFGLGYSAEHFVARFGDGFDRIVGTVRGAERAAVLNARFGGRLKVLAFDGTLRRHRMSQARSANPTLRWFRYPRPRRAIRCCTPFGTDLAHASRLRSVVYLSTIGVYGDHGGAWVDEKTPPRPDSERARERLAVEQAWQAFGERSHKAVAILRLAGIYGPGRNALVQIARGEARRIVKPGQVFNRIHVGDIAQAIDAAFAREADGIFNVADDEPSPAGRSDRVRRATSRPRSAAGNPVRRRRSLDVADGPELLAGMPARPQRQAQARTRSHTRLSDLPRRVARPV